MDGSENSGSRIGRTIWTVWGYLSGAVGRYLRPEVTDEGNQNSVVLKNTANEINREENEAEKKEGKKFYENEKNTEVKCLLPGARMQVASAQWENTDVVINDHNEPNVNTTEKQTHHCALWSTSTDHGESVSGDVDSNGHKQKSGTRTLDVQINNENEERQKSKACVEKEAVSSEASSEDNVEHKVSETEREPEEIVDIEKMHGTNEDKKEEECDQDDHGDDDVVVCELLRDQNNAEVTVQSELYGQDVEQEKLINKRDYGETAGIRGTEYITDFPREKVVEHVIDEKEQQTVVQNQDLEKDEDYEDKETESQVKDLEVVDVFPNPLETESKKYSEEIIENEHISKNDQDKDIEESEQQDWPDSFELTCAGICNVKEVCDVMLGEIQTAQTKNIDETKSESLKSLDTLPRASEEIFEKIIPSTEIGMKTAKVVDEFFEIVTTSKDILQSDISKQDTPQTGIGSPVVSIKPEAMFSDLTGCELSREPKIGPEIGSKKTVAVDQIKTVETALGCFGEIKIKFHEPNTLTEEHSQRDTVVAHSVELQLQDSKEAFEIEQDIDSFSATQNQTLQEMDKTKFSLKEHDKLKTDLTVETIATKVSSKEEKVKPFETNRQADGELLELTTESECKLPQATMNTISEPLEDGEKESLVVCEIAGTESYPADIKLDAEDAPEAKIGPVGSLTGLTRPLSPAEFLDKTLDLQKDSESYSGGQENREVRLLDKTTLEYVEEITNQCLREMIDMENILGQEVEPLVELSTEQLCDAEFQELPTCALDLKHENMEAFKESIKEMKVETAICEVVKKQKNDHTLSSVTNTTEADEEVEEKGTALEAVLCSHEDIMEIRKSVIKRRFDDVRKDVPEVKIEEENSPLTDWSTTVDLDVQALKDSSLDFGVQKSRIAVKNPLVRPPKDPRKLIFKASVEPFLPKPQPCGLLKAGQGIAVSVPSKGVIGFKLPGLGAVMPTLRKTEFGKKAKEEGEAESQLQGQEQQKSVAVKEDSVKQELASLKPKWTPPRHPGMGSPLMMAELKGKLKKPVKESNI